MFRFRKYRLPFEAERRLSNLIKVSSLTFPVWNEVALWMEFSGAAGILTTIVGLFRPLSEVEVMVVWINGFYFPNLDKARY